MSWSSLLDAVNAYPLVKDSAGGRSDDIEPDVLILAGPVESALLLVGDVKKTDGNPWSALVQNLRQLRLFTANSVCASLFSQRGMKVNVDQICGAVRRLSLEGLEKVGLLETSGIDVMIQADTAGRMREHLAWSGLGHRVLVREEDADAARSLLALHQDDELVLLQYATEIQV